MFMNETEPVCKWDGVKIPKHRKGSEYCSFLCENKSEGLRRKHDEIDGTFKHQSYFNSEEYVPVPSETKSYSEYQAENRKNLSAIVQRYGAPHGAHTPLKPRVQNEY